MTDHRDLTFWQYISEPRVTYPDGVTGDDIVFVGPKMGNQEAYGPIPARMIDWENVRAWRLARLEKHYS